MTQGAWFLTSDHQADAPPIRQENRK